MKKYLTAALLVLLTAALVTAAPPQAPPVQAPPVKSKSALKSEGCPCAEGKVNCGCDGEGGGGCWCGAAGKSHARASQERTGLGARGGVRDTHDQASGPAPLILPTGYDEPEPRPAALSFAPQPVFYPPPAAFYPAPFFGGGGGGFRPPTGGRGGCGPSG